MPAAIRELEKIEMIRGIDNIYRLDHAVAATQKIILNAFGINVAYMNFSPQSDHEQTGRRPGVVISNDQFFIRTKFAVVCPITNTSNKFPLHIPLENRTKTTGVILTEHMKCLDVISRNIQFVEKMPEDLLEKTLAYVKAFF